MTGRLVNPERSYSQSPTPCNCDPDKSEHTIDNHGQNLGKTPLRYLKTAQQLVNCKEMTY